MTRHEHLLAIAAEEGAEVAQRCTKALRFGLYEVQPVDDGLHPPTNPDGLNNGERIQHELADLLGVLSMLGLFELRMLDNYKYFQELARLKTLKVERFLAYSATVGTLLKEEA